MSTALRTVLAEPIGSPPLREFVATGDTVTVVVSDITRPASAKLLLPVILEELSHASQVRILVALGLHRRLEETELKELLGWKIAKSLPVFQHDAHARSRLIFLGRTRYGTEVQLSRFLLPEETYRAREVRDRAQSLKIVLTGTIAPHYFYGFSGGRKSILPGAASALAIKQNHCLLFGAEGERLQECRAGNLARNPCHLDSLDASKMIGNSFVVNIVQTPAAGVLTVVAGDMKEAHLEGCRTYVEHCSSVLSGPFDVVVAGCGGYPRDINFIQCHKAIESAFSAVHPGGTIVIAGECSDGIGDSGFLKWFMHKDLAKLRAALQRDYEVYGQTAFTTLWKARKADILLVSSLKSDDVRAMSMRPVQGLNEALEFVKGKHGNSYSACLMPFAADTLVKDETIGLE